MATARAGAGRLAAASIAAVAACWAAGGAASAATYPVPPPPVVLITGLHDSHAGMTPGGDCNAIGTMASLCSALVADGQRVYVVSAAAGGGAVINNAGPIDPNGQAFANYLKNTVGGPAFIVGHSMGGIIARIAISRFGAQAAGLFTIGSPEDGSFGADLGEGVVSIPCSGIICSGLEAAAKAIVAQFGAAAVEDLTSSARAADNANLSPVGVHLWEYAGTACSAPDPTGYYFPNDGIVGRSSAFGATANMGPATQTQGNDFHQSTLQTVLKLVCSPLSGTNIELGDPSVIGQVVAAVNCTDTQTCRGAAADVQAAIKHKQSKRHKKRKRRVLVQPRIHLHIELLSAHSQTASAGAPVTVTDSTTVVSTTPFEAECNGQQYPALAVLSGQLFGVDPQALNCGRVTITSTATTSSSSTPAPLQIAVLSDAKNVTASVVGHGKDVQISVSATGSIAAVALSSHGRTVHARATGLGSRGVKLTVARTKAGNTTLTATVGGLRYAGQIPTLPAAYYKFR